MVGFLFGVFAASSSWDVRSILTVAVISGISFSALSRSKYILKLSFLFISALLFGSFYYHFHSDWNTSQTNLPLNEKISFQVLISDEPQPSEKFDILTADAQPPQSGVIRILAPPLSGFRYGDLLKVKGVLDPGRVPGEDPAMFSPSIMLVARHRGFWLREKLIDLKLAILEHFNAVLGKDEAALLGGITFGSKVNFDPALKQDMALSGTTHLVAISGYNITIIIVAVGDVLGRVLSRRKLFYATLGFIMLFLLMSGFQASAIRAAIMGFLALLARQTGKLFNMRNAITATAVAMTLFEPTILAENIGFQLSFLSLLGIVYAGPALKRLLHQEGPGMLGWKESSMTTLSAQLGTMPVLIHAFGRFSATAVFANILVLGTVPFTMCLGFILALLGFISSYPAFFIGKIAGLLLAYQLSVIKMFAALAVPIPISFNSTLAIAAYYSLLGIFIFSYGKHHGKPQKN